MDYKIAIVEDDELILNMVKINFAKCGCTVYAFSDAEKFLEENVRNNFDILILDIMLPGISGLDLLKHLRENKSNLPVLIMTAKSDLQTKISGLNIGADDYIHKPFSMDELIARVRAIVRRSRSERMIPSNKIITINGFNINLESRECESNFGKTMLSEKEVRFLEFFVVNAGLTIKRADILEEVWGMDVSPTPRTVDNFILKFRKFFESDTNSPKHFISVRSKGYKFRF